MEEPGSGRLSRRRFIRAAGGAVGAVAVGAGVFEAVRQTGGGQSLLPSTSARASGTSLALHSRPDLRLPSISAPAPHNFDADYLFMGPVLGGSQPGPLIVDRQGEAVWFKPVFSGSAPQYLATAFKPFMHRGEPVLAWWEGRVVDGLGRGEVVMVDSSYREVARVRAAHGRQVDLHELQLTPQGTVLFACHPEVVRADLTSIGGPRDGTVLNSIFQEVDLRTGRLLLEWRSLDHIPISECVVPTRSADAYRQLNYFYLNSIGLTPDDNLLISGRHTWALYKLDRRTGRVIWRLGGKRSDFALDRQAEFKWQHDARQPVEGTISVFDNGSAGGPMPEVRYARGLVLKVDEARRRVSLSRAFRHPEPLLAIAMGSVQIRPNANVVVGWGNAGYVGEFTSDGRLLSDARVLEGSYRALLQPWRGAPQRPPDLAVRRVARAGKTVVYASWNGDTETAYWQVHGGANRSGMRPIGIARRRGLETAIPVGDTSGYFSVTALDRNRRPLAHSMIVRAT